MPFDNPASTFMMKNLIENYFTFEEDGWEMRGLNSTLLMKNGYVKFSFLSKKVYSLKGKRYSVPSKFLDELRDKCFWNGGFIRDNSERRALPSKFPS